MVMRREFAWAKIQERIERLNGMPEIMRILGRKSYYRMPLGLIEQLEKCKDDDARRVLIGPDERRQK